jgi:hypothetical protein
LEKRTHEITKFNHSLLAPLRACNHRTSSQKNLAAETHALHVRINELEAELKRHLEAVVFLSNTKRDSQGLRGSVPELLQ